MTERDPDREWERWKERGFSWLHVTKNRKTGFPWVSDVTADPVVLKKKEEISYWSCMCKRKIEAH